VEESRIGVRHVYGAPENLGRRSRVRMDLVEQLDRLAGPYGPVTEQPSDDSLRHPAEVILAKEVDDDAVVVSSVERDLSGSAGLRYGTHHVDRPVTVERSDLDRDHVGDLGEATPEAKREHAAA